MRHRCVRRVSVSLRGGLGNQLFQYAAGLYFAQKNSRCLHLNSYLLPSSPKTVRRVSAWPEQISSFEHDGLVGDFGPSLSFVKKLDTIARVASDSLGDLLPRFGFFVANKDKNWWSIGQDFEPRVISSYMIGPDLVLPNQESLLRQIMSIREPSTDFVSSVGEAQRRIAVHLRLGDFKDMKNDFESNPVNYLTHALSLVQSSVEEPNHVALYSDYPIQAREILLQVSPRLDIWSPPSSMRPIEHLNLVGAGRSLIGSASTFSWWGGFIQNAKGLQIFPRPWEGVFGREPSRVLLDHWIQIGR